MAARAVGYTSINIMGTSTSSISRIHKTTGLFGKTKKRVPKLKY
jgi:hypothetical protein